MNLCPEASIPPAARDAPYIVINAGAPPRPLASFPRLPPLCILECERDMAIQLFNSLAHLIGAA
jgi:hypothetical protein